MHPELKQVRLDWYSAYFAGNVKRLAEIESADFKVISPRGVEDGRERLEAIAEALKVGRWYPTGSLHVDEELEWRQVSAGIAEAIGNGRVIT